MRLFIMLLALMGMVSAVGACGKSVISPEAGQNLAVIKGCVACHSVDETPKIGPSWAGLYGSVVELDDGSFVNADDAYLIESTKDPNAKIVRGFSMGAMPVIPLTEDELGSIVSYIKSIE